MQFSYNWLKEFLPDLTLTAAELAELLTMRIFETEVTGTLRIDPQVTVAKIIKIAPHPNADRLRLATITTGTQEVTVVCGAPNINEGDLVPFSPPGTQLIDDHGEKFTLKPATIRGVESPGMLNSPRELGLGESHSGIYILPPDTPLGSQLAAHLPDDTLLEVEITPNRAHDCASHRGLAREIAAILALSLNEPKPLPIPNGSPYGWQIKVENPADLTRYFLIPVTQLKAGLSPLWLQARLWAAGTRPINNIVDITNYVTFELGNPSHAFDSDKLPGRIIHIRRATASEKIQALDGERRTLTSQDVVIAAGDEPQAIAGIIGGAGSEVSDTTINVLIEVATFAAYPIQQTSARLRVHTASSTRFAKGLSPLLAEEAAQRIVQLLQEITGGRVDGYLEHYPEPAQPLTIPFRPERVAAVAGTAISTAECRRLLTHMRSTVAEREAGSAWQVTPPLERLDLTGEHDLVEEVIRLSGLDAVPAQPLAAQAAQALPRPVQIRELIRDELVQAGFTETYNRPFAIERFSEALGLATATALTLVNPQAPEQSRLRISLLPGLLANLVTNKGEVRQRKPRDSRNLFEIGSVWHTGGSTWVKGIAEEEWVAGVVVDPLDVVDVVRTILQRLGAAAAPDSIWQAGPVSAPALASLRLPSHIQFFAINLTQLAIHVADDFAYQPELLEGEARYQAIGKYPPVIRDISLLVDPDLTVEAVQEVIERAGRELVVDVDLFDEYQPSDTDKKALAFRLTYQSPDHTLTADEVARLHNNIVATLQQEMAVELRE